MVLARRYRPRCFSELIGQDILVKALTNAIISGHIPHAFLFHGIRGTGKTTTARILARSLNCLTSGPTIQPCGTCASCQSFEKDNHIDVVEMDAASHTSVENIREIVESSRYRPINGHFKIFIIDEVHMLSKSAFNALLKTLEEPPPHVKFIFATTELRKIPETILSRCLRFDLKRIETSCLISHLQEILKKEGATAEGEAIGSIVRVAGGSARDALSLLDQALLLSEKNVTFDIVKSMLGLTDRSILFDVTKALLESHIQKILEITQSVIENGGDPVHFTESLLDFIYWLATFKTHPALEKDITWPAEDRKLGKSLIENLELTILLRLWQALLKGYEDVVKSPLPEQALDMVMMRLCFVRDLPPLETVLKRFQGGGAKQPSQPFP